MKYIDQSKNEKKLLDDKTIDVYINLHSLGLDEPLTFTELK